MNPLKEALRRTRTSSRTALIFLAAVIAVGLLVAALVAIFRPSSPEDPKLPGSNAPSAPKHVRVGY